MAGIKPVPIPATEYTKRYLIEGNDPIAIAIGDIESNAQVLLKVQFTRPVGMIDPAIYYCQGVIQAELQRLVGIDGLQFEIQTSIDNISWFGDVSVSSVGGTLALAQNILGQSFSVDGVLYLRFAMFNGDGATSGTIENYKAFCEVLLPSGYTATRLI